MTTAEAECKAAAEEDKTGLPNIANLILFKKRGGNCLTPSFIVQINYLLNPLYKLHDEGKESRFLPYQMLF